MKRIISLLLVLLLILSTLFLVACDENDKKDEGKETKAKVTQKVDDDDDDDDDDENAETTAAPKEPVPVDSLNGKSVKQLVEQFIAEYTVARSFDMSMNMIEAFEGETEEINISFKLTETEAYVSMDMYGEKMAVWYVDGVAYIESADGKFKREDISVDEILGEDFFEEMMSAMPTEMDDTVAAKYDEAQLYYFKNAYYITISYSDDEVEQMGGGSGYTETIYFDTDGNLRKIEMKAEENSAVVCINSYGKPLQIDPPANASEFKEPDNSGIPPQIEEV